MLVGAGSLGFFYNASFDTGDNVPRDAVLGILDVNAWHNLVHLDTGLPLAWTVETASAAESPFALALIDQARERGFAVATAIMDKGYDNGPIHDGCMDRDVAPVTALRKTERVKRGEHKPPTCEHGEWTFAGADYKRRATKWRCPTGECKPASRWVKADRLHPLIPRETGGHASSTNLAELWNANSAA